MAKRENPFRKVLLTTVQNLMREVDGLLTPIPQKVCECGKPVVFPQGKKVFTCTRCGARWVLEVQVKRIKFGKDTTL